MDAWHKAISLGPAGRGIFRIPVLIAALACLGLAIFLIYLAYGQALDAGNSDPAHADGARMVAGSTAAAMDDALAEAVLRGRAGHLNRPLPVYGQSGAGGEKLLELQWDSEALADIDWRSATPSDLEQLAFIRIAGPQGVKAVDAYCRRKYPGRAPNPRTVSPFLNPGICG